MIDEVLHVRIRAVDKEPVDEHSAVEGLIRGADEVRRIPSVTAQQRHFHVVKVQLCRHEADVR